MDAEFFLLISALFSFIACCLAVLGDSNTVVRNVLGFFIFIYIVLYALYSASDYFTGAGINEATVYHLSYGLSGAGYVEYRSLIIKSALLCLLGIFMWMLVVLLKVKADRICRLRFKNTLAIVLSIMAILLNPATICAYKISKTDVARAASPTFSEFYDTEISKLDKPERNFVFIYLEGLESSFFNEELFPGLVVELKKIRAESVNFTDIDQTVGSGWTIAGLVASQCGVPLFAGNSMSGMDAFMPGATCLGDILSSSGYHLAYYGGADLTFAGKGDFFSSHQFSETNGLRELLPQTKNKDYVNGWGLYDDVLLDLVFKRYLELSASKEKFGLFLLTLDTHHPDGLPSASCNDFKYHDGENSMLNAVACSDRLVSRFVERIRSSRYGADTVIFIASDHLAMRNSVSEKLDKLPRKNLFMVLDPAEKHPRIISKKGTSLDIGATILPFVGLRGNIGLGRDLSDQPDSLAVTVQDLNGQLLSWQPSILKLWDFPKIEQALRIDAASRQMNIDGRSFALPALIKIKDDLGTEIVFGSNSVRGKNELLDQVRQLDTITPFIWIDECSRVNAVSDKPYSGELCLAVGRLNANPDKKTIHGKFMSIGPALTMDASEIKTVLSIGGSL